METFDWYTWVILPLIVFLARLLDVTLASLEDPEAVRPDHHSWTSSRIAWFETADDLPRHPERAEAVAGLLEKAGLRYRRRTTLAGPDKRVFQRGEVACRLLPKPGRLAQMSQTAATVNS